LHVELKISENSNLTAFKNNMESMLVDGDNKRLVSIEQVS